jgi:hypothetical protein
MTLRWTEIPSEKRHALRLSLFSGINENRRLYFVESAANDNEEGTQDGQMWTMAYIEHHGTFISGDLNICCQNFACNTAVARCQQKHNSLLLSQGHTVGKLAATARKVCLCALFVCSCLQHTCLSQQIIAPVQSCDSASKRTAC